MPLQQGVAVMPQLEEMIARLSRLPLADAAFEIWTRRYRWDRLEQPTPPKPREPRDLSDPQTFRAVVQQAMAKVEHEYATADEGPTLRRLKMAHPGAEDESLKRAITAAVKLDRDCVKFFSYDRSPNYSENLSAAMQLVRKHNPGFLEETYRLAEFELATAMR